jgi:proteasome component ECM29
MLSISHPAWFTGKNRYNYSAASLLGEDSIVGSRTNSTELRVALRPHLGKLLPRIQRATHDPNKQTREQMSSLWIGLTGGGSESRAAVTEHLLPIVDSLIEDCTSKMWRARSAACSALAEVLVGRSWEDLGGGPAQLDDDDIHIKTSNATLTAGIRVLRLFRYVIAASRLEPKQIRLTRPIPMYSLAWQCVHWMM